MRRAAVFVFLALWARAAGAEEHLVQRAHETMGTVVSVMAWTDDDERAVKAIAEAFAEFDRVNAMMSTWLPDSDVSRLNAQAGAGWVKVSPEIVAVLEKSLWGSRLSRGAFDVTVGAFKGVWKFDEDKDGTIPEDALVKQRKRLVDWRDLKVNANKGLARLRRKGQQVTLGGVAKGYATDRAVAILRSHGITDFILQAGGDMYVSGRRGDRLWRVGIRDPRDEHRGSFFAMAEVEDRTFSTSGDYERAVVKDGRRYHHILDPRTGYPAMKCRSVTVMARDALTADILSTALFVMGPAEGMKLVEKLPDVDAVFVTADNEVRVSSGLRGKLTILRPPSDGV